ncbi:aspartic peptidase domain-containing protein [Coprinopsis sp. MPI-PUGE-AT-0042]|nr:aspartic peptidase domain-containing protein [Coprinopsis sp. MPI-PUGE-AT-0042]
MFSLAALSGFLALQVTASPRPLLVPRSDLVTIPVHTLQARAVSDNDTTTHASLTQLSMSSNRQSYFTVIKVGGIPYRVALDTASADLWLLSSDCETPECSQVPRFQLGYQSPSFDAVNDNSTLFEASYADGTVASGFLARETVEVSNLSMSEQVFGLVSESNVTFGDHTSGLLGLGFPELSSFTSNSTNFTTPFFSNLAQKGLLEYPLFAFSLTRNNTGSLSFGAIDASVVANASDIAWNQVASFPPFNGDTNSTEPTYLQWAIPLTGLYINGTSLELNSTYAEQRAESLALIDIGAAGIYGPVDAVAEIFSLIEGSRLIDSDGQWAVPCDTNLPFTFTFGSSNYTLLPEDYIIGPALGNPNLCLSWPQAYPPHPDGIDWQLGTAFLRTVYSIYNYGINTKEPPLIGFYSIRNETLAQNITQTPEELASFFSAHSATVTTTLPNFLLATPSYTTPPYALNSSIYAPIGAVVTSDLATSTYSALFGTFTTFNASAIPTISPNQSFHTLTDSAGRLTVSASLEADITEGLGIPPGWPQSSGSRSDAFLTYPTLLLVLLLSTVAL